MLDHTGLYILNTERFKPKTIGHLLTQTEKMVFARIKPAEIVAVMCKRGGRS
ncbi:conjugation system SOS inhibitor PsiB family protein [Pantoea sp. SO10]|uniref:conjugation system SOS inhibitor PsiB family protein n=1 Tax=Pantoea sp. SO10 TaxID=2575375 RepID=UPI00352B0FAC